MANFKNIAHSFSKAAGSYQQHALVQNAMGQELLAFLQQTLERWGYTEHAWATLLEIGCGPGNFTQQVLSKLPLRHLLLNDLSPQMLEQARKLVTEEKPFESTEGMVDGIQLSNTNHTSAGASTGASAASKPFTLRLIEGNILEVAGTIQEPVDLIVSNAVFQWLPLGEVLACCQRLAQSKAAGKTANKTAGPVFLAFSSFSLGNFAELKSCMGAGAGGLPYLSLREIETQLKCHTLDFELRSEQRRQYFSSSRELLRHLKLTGVNGVEQAPLSVGQMRALSREYERRFRDEAGVYVTWCPYYVVARLS